MQRSAKHLLLSGLLLTATLLQAQDLPSDNASAGIDSAVQETAAAVTVLSLEAKAEKHEPKGEVANLTLDTEDSTLLYNVLYSIDRELWKETQVTKRKTDTAEVATILSVKIPNDEETYFKVTVLSQDSTYRDTLMTESPVMTKVRWFNIRRSNMLFAILLISALIIYYIERAKKARHIYLRPIAGLKAFEEAVGRATEMGKSVLYVPGIQDLDQVETIAGIIILGHVAKMTSRYETDLNVPVSRSLVMEASREIVHESYLSEGRPDLYNPNMVHYLTDDQFAFAAGVNGIMLREKPAALFFQGKFFAESLILAETGNSIGAIQIAGTASPAQIPFFVTACDYTLIGEEFFAASAYLGKDPKLMGSIKGQDIAKAVIMISIGVGVILQTFGFTWFRDLFKVM